MSSAITRKDILWGFAAQFLNVGAGLLLLPVILRYLNSDDTALWFVFMTLGGLAQLLEFGFQPTLIRNVAYVYAGADLILKADPSQNLKNLGCIDELLLSDLFTVSRKIYGIISYISAFALLIGGTWYISTLVVASQDHFSVLIGWCFFASGYVANFYFGHINAFLQGRGDVRNASKVIIYNRVSLIFIGSLLTILGFGLLGLGLSSLIASIVGRVSAIIYFEKPEKRMRTKNSPSSTRVNELRRTLWKNTWRLGAVQLGAFLIQRGNILIGTTLLGLNAMGSYNLTTTLMMALVNFGMVVCNLNMPYMSSSQVRCESQGLRIAYAKSIASAVGVFGIASAFLIIAGNWTLGLVGAQTMLLPTFPLLVMCLMYLLELHHSVAANYITTMNTIPFVKAAVYSGMSIIALSFLMVPYYGVWALIWSQFLVQIVYNNWKWPVMASLNLKTSVADIFFVGFKLLVCPKDQHEKSL